MIGYDPIQQQERIARQRRVKIDKELPAREAYAAFIQQFIDTYEAQVC